MSRLIQAASAAADDAEALDRDTHRNVDPRIPLTAYPRPLEDFDRAVSAASAGLHYAVALAAGVIGPDPVPAALSHVPARLAIAETRVTRASETHIWGTRRAISRELRKAGAAPEPHPAPTARSAAIAWHSISRLEDALAAADADGTDLGDLMIVVLQQSTILACLARASERYYCGVAAACDSFSGPAASRATSTAAPLRRASEALRKAAKGTAAAHGDLADAVIRARKQAAP